MQETQFDPWVGKILWSWKWQPIPVFLPEKSQEEPGRLQSMGLQRVRHDLATKRQHKFGDIEIYLMVLAQRQFRKKFSFLSEVLRTKERIAMMNKNISTKKELSKQFRKYL